MSEMQSIYIPSSSRDLFREVFEQQTDSILFVDLTNKERKDPDTIDLGVASYSEQINLYVRNIRTRCMKRSKFYQTRSNVIILHETLPTVVRIISFTNQIRESICVISASSTDFFEAYFMKELVSEVGRQSKGLQRIQNPNHDRTRRPVVCLQTVGLSLMLNEMDIDFGIWIVTYCCETSREFFVFGGSSRRSRIILIDKIFRPI